MGTVQSIFKGPRSKGEDEQQRQQLHPFLHNDYNYNYNYQKPHNGASFGSSSSFFALFKNLLLRIFKFRPFAKPRKTEPMLPVVNPTNNPSILQIQDTSLSSSDSSSSPNAIYVPGADLNFQLWSDQYHYSSSEDEVYATTATWLQKLPVSSAVETGSNGNEDGGLHYNNEMDVIIDVPSLDFQSLARTDMFDVVDSAFLSIEKEENEVEEVEEEKVINCCVRVEGKWIKHYNSYHWILLVGDGDFSFSASLAVAFGYAPNMIATSLDSIEFLKKNYRRAMSNIEKLRRSESIVMHGIDATKIASHDLFGGMTFDRIIFNFPHAGFFKDLSREAQLGKHRRLVSLFLKNAKDLVGENGEIHITHKANGFHKEWMLESLASSQGLRLIEAADFNRHDYKGFNTKYGFGGDNNFNCHTSKTYKFGLKVGSSSAY